MNENYTKDTTKDEAKKEAYVKPESEIVNLEVEQPILTGSADNFGSGGRWGF